LHAAAEGGNVHVITRLLKAGAGGDINAKSHDYGRTPLDLAVIGGKEAAAKALIMAGGDVNARDGVVDGALSFAIEGGHVRIAKDLLLSGANPMLEGRFNDNSFIYLAASYGLDEVVLALVQQGAEVNCVNDDGDTPLRVAVRESHVATVKVLLAEGADPNFTDPAFYSEPVLHLAVEAKRTAVIRALVEAGA
ncbi:unnamed protein product, partial [Ectocarpus fasciculatus]